MGTVPYTGEARQPNILAPCIIFSILSPLAVALRFYSRKLSGAGVWWDDWTVLVALPMAIGFNILMLWGLSVGFGASPSPERAKHLAQFFQALYASEILYNTALPFIKISILLLYRRVFPTPFMVKAVWVVGALNIVWFLGTEPTIIFQCTPIRKAWYHEEVEGKCFVLKEFLLGQAISSLIIDGITILLPIRLVMKLNMPLKRRLFVCAIFLVGGVAITCGIIRLPYILGTLHDNTPYTDLYVFEPGNIWSLAELHVALICACLPTVHPAFKQFRGKDTTHKSAGYPYTSSGYHRTRSPTMSSKNRAVDRGAQRLTRNEYQREAIARFAGQDTTGAGDDVELGDLKYASRQGLPPAPGGLEISVRRDVEVFADEGPPRADF